MRISLKNTLFSFAVLLIAVFAFCYNAVAQGTSGTIQGVVKDQSGAVVASAKVEISNPVSGFRRETTTGGAGDFRFSNIPFNSYHLAVTAKTFAPYSQDVDVRAAVPMALDISLTVGGAMTTVEVTADAKDRDLPGDCAAIPSARKASCPPGSAGSPHRYTGPSSTPTVARSTCDCGAPTDLLTRLLERPAVDR
jgi:hypothetical protein